MSGFCLLSAFSRLSMISPIQQNIRSITTFKALQFRATPCLWAEPLKKKKKMDPAIIRQRDERRKKKIEKQIRRLEKNARQLKVIDENEEPHILVDERAKRTRKSVVISSEVVEARALLEKSWSRQVTQERMEDIRNIDRIASSQRRALEALRQESEELYEEAIQVDLSLIPYSSRGPVATPPIKGYATPDGEYLDVSKNWDEV